MTERVEVTPRADGKADVKFFSAGHKFADLTMIKTPADLAAQFTAGTGASWTAQHFTAAGSYNLALRVSWVASTNLNKNGVPYKNVTKIENA